MLAPAAKPVLLPYEPLIVRAVPSRRDPGNAVAFYQRQLCLFENDEPAPAIDQEVEVMATRALYKRHAETGQWLDQISVILLRVVSDKWQRIAFDGFEMFSDSALTSAALVVPKKDAGRTITPGRTAVIVAGEYGSKITAPQPGWGFVNRDEYERGKRPLRLEGLADPNMATYAQHIKRTKARR